MQEEKPAFVTTMANTFVQQKSHKPFFGKPYILAGEYWGVCEFLFEQGSLLGRLFSNKDSVLFMRVFVAHEGKEQTALDYLYSRVSKEIIPLIDEASSFRDLIYIRESARINSSDNYADFFMKHWQDKLPQVQCAVLAAEWAAYGGCLGLHKPDIIADLFETSHKPDPEWDEAYKLGVVSKPSQPVRSIDDAEKEDFDIFKEYCEQFYPELLPTLF